MASGRRLDRLFRAIVMSVSGPAALLGWASCNDPPPAPDAGDGSTTGDGDAAAADQQESSISFADTGALDSYVVWCDAGPPELLGSDVSGDQYYWMPCGLPEGDYVTEAGIVNRCDQFCPPSARAECSPVDPATIAQLFPDAGADASDASEDASADPGLYIMCGTYQGGRKPVGLRRPPPVRASPLGGYFAQMTFFESAAVHAFRRMKKELAALGASRTMLARVDRAQRDEACHAAVMRGLARRHGVTARGASVRPLRPRSVRAMARENAVEGCVQETYSALVATWQAAHARSPEVRRVMARVARDETRHAELSWDVARLLDGRVDAATRRTLRHAQERAIAELRGRMGREPERSLVALAGVPGAREAQRLVDALAAALFPAA